MEALFLYLAKASGLLALFYLTYHLLLRKDTFFNSNRWFLLSGLITSLLLPLFFIKRILWVTKPKISMEELVAYTQQTPSKIKELPPIEAFDWIQLIWLSYCLVAFVLVTKIALNLLSLYQMIYKQQTIKKEGYTLVNLKCNIAPFSFFNYIVCNSDFYSDTELRSIILHEQIHSKEYHSIDVLLAQLFSAIFWFNPLVWLYKKAITQNLEYIADQKAIEQMEDKKSYQRALLKVVSHQSCLSITNNFYQSLIKKRIVMLNKNQSHKRNSWKYTFIIPALIGFVLLFQIKTIAQQKDETTKTKYTETHQGVDITFDSKETDKSLKTLKNVFKEEKIITEVSKVKRNSAGEITGICIKMKCEDGRKKELKINQSTPIDKIFMYTNRLENGLYDFGIKHITDDEINAIRSKADHKRQGIYSANNNEAFYAVNVNDSLDMTGNFDFNFDFDMEAPEAPEAPEVAEVPDASEAVEMNDKISKVIVRKNGDRPLVIINGKVITDDKTIQETMKNLYIDDNSSSSDGEKKQIFINLDDAVKIRNKALANAKIKIKRMRPIIKKQIRMANGDWKKVKEEMERAQLEIEASKPEMEKVKAEMQKTKEEMIKAKEEMLKAKVEFENEKAALQKSKSK